MGSQTQTLTLSLIQSAQRGDADDRSRLAELIRPQVYAYIYRMTLDTHAAEDMCQETMVSLFQSLENLTFEAPGCLWGWIYKTALNQIRDNYHRQRAIQNGIKYMKHALSGSARDNRARRSGPEHVMHQELLNSVTRAIKTLKFQYRNVLTLRCFQQLSFAEIARVLGSSELGARMLFFRAKQSLTQQLKRDGFSKSQLLSGLTLFAAATLAPTEKAAAVTISTAVMHATWLTRIVSVLATTKLGIGLSTLAALSLIPVVLSLIPDRTAGRFHPVPEADMARGHPAYPTAVRRAYDPDQTGWLGALLRDDHTEQAHHPIAIRLEQWLADPAGPNDTWLHLPQDHWVELTFPGTLIDGAGDDVFITERCQHGETAEVYLVDQDGNTRLLGVLQVPATWEHNVVTYGCDLAGLSKPFPATTLRIKCINSGFYEYRTALPGMELLHVRARIQ